MICSYQIETLTDTIEVREKKCQKIERAIKNARVCMHLFESLVFHCFSAGQLETCSG